MKRAFSVIFGLMAVIFMAIPLSGTAEAARVAALPIQINEEKVERAADFTGYYWDVIINKFTYPDYELMDDEKVENQLPVEGLASFDQATLAGLADKLGAEIVVAMKLDNVSERPMTARSEPTVSTFMQGEFALYNRLTGKYYNRKIYHKGQIEEVLTLRTDWQQDVFGAELKRCIYRAMEEKKNKKK